MSRTLHFQMGLTLSTVPWIVVPMFLLAILAWIVYTGFTFGWVDATSPRVGIPPAAALAVVAPTVGWLLADFVSQYRAVFTQDELSLPTILGRRVIRWDEVTRVAYRSSRWGPRIVLKSPKRSVRLQVGFYMEPHAVDAFIRRVCTSAEFKGSLSQAMW